MLVALLGVWLLSWVVPDHFPPWLSFHAEVPSFAVAIFALGAFWKFSGRIVQLPLCIGLIALLIFGAILQWMGGLLAYGGDVLLVAIYLSTFASMWLLGYQYAYVERKTDLINVVATFLISAALITAFQVLVQWFQVEGAMGGGVIDGLRNGRPRGNVGQPNQAATILLMGTVGVAVLRHRARIGALVMWCTALLLGFAIVLTQSRTALLSAVVVSGLFVYFGRQAAHKSPMRITVLLWLSLLLCAAWVFPGLSLSGTGASITTDQMMTSGTRPLIWKQLIIGLFESPWVGWGWLQVPAAHQAGAVVLSGTEQTNYAHNVVLDLFLFIGIPASCVVLAAIGVWGLRRIHAVIASTEATAACFLLLPFLVHCLLEFPHAYAYFLAVAGLLLGAIDGWTKDLGTKVLAVPKWTFAAFITLYAALVMVIGYEYVQAEEDFRVNRFENKRMGDTPSDYIPPKLILLTQLGDMLKAMRLRAQPGMTNDELDTLVNVSRRYSWAPMQFRTALALGLNGRPTEATQQLRVIKGLFAADIYEEAKENFVRMQKEEYPELSKVEIP